MSERFMELVLKTSDPKGPGVRIPLSPPNEIQRPGAGAGFSVPEARYICVYIFTVEKYSSGEEAPLLRE